MHIWPIVFTLLADVIRERPHTTSWLRTLVVGHSTIGHRLLSVYMKSEIMLEFGNLITTVCRVLAALGSFMRLVGAGFGGSEAGWNIGYGPVLPLLILAVARPRLDRSIAKNNFFAAVSIIGMAFIFAELILFDGYREDWQYRGAEIFVLAILCVAHLSPGTFLEPE